MRVRRIAGAHLVDGRGEQARAVEDVGILGEEAEDQPGEKMVEILPAGGRVPLRVVLQQLDVEAIEAARGLDVEGVLADLLNGGDARERQEEAEFIAKAGIGAGDGLAIDEVFGFDGLAIGGEDELGLISAGGSALSQRGQGRRHFAFRADLEMDVVALQHPAGQIGLVRISALEPFKGGLLVAEGFEEGVGKSVRVERRFGEPGNGFFDFDCVHRDRLPEL